MTETYPLSLGKVTPGPDFTKMPLGKGMNGLPEGVHTGGPYLSPNGKEVWKPLDCRPFPNCPDRFSTSEAECLEEMAGTPGFPRNWRVVEQNGRRWLVRPKCRLSPQEIPFGRTHLAGICDLVKTAIRTLNAKGWEAFGSDLPQVAHDPKGDWLILDLSAAFKPRKWNTGWHGDRDALLRWFDAIDCEWMTQLHRRGSSVAHNIAMSFAIQREAEPWNVDDVFHDIPKDQRGAYRHIYASTHQPLSTTYVPPKGKWTEFEPQGSVRFMRADPFDKPYVYTWVVADHPLASDEIKQYQLIHAYSPWP